MKSTLLSTDHHRPAPNMDYHHNDHHVRRNMDLHGNVNPHNSVDHEEVYDPGMPSRYNPRLPGTHPSDVIMKNEEDHGGIQQIMLPEFHHEEVPTEFRSEHRFAIYMQYQLAHWQFVYIRQ